MVADPAPLEKKKSDPQPMKYVPSWKTFFLRQILAGTFLIIIWFTRKGTAGESYKGVYVF